MKISSEQPQIIVVGSSSIDLVLDTKVLPQQNETVIADKYESFFGGKGANQAVACARLGADVYFIGCVGMDPYGQQILRNLVDEGVNVGFVAENEESPTGTAYVTTAKGVNMIVVVPASNYCLTTKNIADAERVFATADLVLIQLEIPMEVVEFTVALAKKHHKKVGIYAAPAKKLSAKVLENADFIVAKSSELSTIFGDKEREQLLTKYPNKLLVRDDSNSTTYFNGSEMKYHRNVHEAVWHKIGMGDAFTAGFGLAKCHGNSMEDCVEFGNEVSLKVAERRGSQTGLPTLEDLDY